MKTLEKLLAAPGGAFISAAWRRPAKTRKGVSALVEKSVAAHSLTFGVAYDNRAVVREGREDGTLPAENAGLRGFTWEVFPRILRADKTGKLYARLNVTAGSKFAAVWFLNGKRVEKSIVAPLLLASETGSGERPVVLNVALDNLTALRCGA
jgi:hypothetical protein